MKIGRNDPCPCGSGIEYKKCCLNKSNEQKLAEAIVIANHNIKNEARIKRCLHPNHDECQGKIVKAHAIQNNRILNRIADNGMLITMDGTFHLMFQASDVKGRGIATTFTGFCKFHDKVLFQDIEDKEFMSSEKQVFLLTYRTMAWHYHKKEEQANAAYIQSSKMLEQGYDLSKSEDFLMYRTGLELGMSDNEREKQLFDDALLTEKYDIISSYIWELSYEVGFAVSMMTELEYDLLGKQINDLARDNKLKKIYLNIFPANGRSFCIWSWAKENDDSYQPFINQFSSLSITERINYLNNMLPLWTDSIVISPRLWNKWGLKIQESLITHANFDIIYRMHETLEDHIYKYMYTPWDFFEDINQIGNASKEDQTPFTSLF